MAKSMLLNVLENTLTYDNQQESDNNATLLTVDFTGVGVDTWAKWLDIRLADGTGAPISLGLGVIPTYSIPAQFMKEGRMEIQAYAQDGTNTYKSKVFSVTVKRSLDVTANTATYDPTTLETLQQAISDIEIQMDEIYDAYNAGAFDGDSAYDVAVDNGFVGSELEWLASLNGADGAQLTSVAFVGNDMVFTKDDTTTVSLVGAKLTLKGDTGSTGATGTSIVSASFVGNDLVFVKSDASTVTIVNGKLTLKGDTGATGIQGVPGNDGLDGESAYEVAVSNGFIGTEAEWLLSLKGAQGEAGEGLPSGGTVGQLLIKQSSTYADAVWADNPSAPAIHNHDDRYYTETETNTLLAGKANSTHTHTIANTISLQGTLDSKSDIAHTHDTRYYTEAEIDVQIALLAPKASPTFTGVVTASQIKFPATQVPSSDPNTLDDYEEGYFTPTIVTAGLAISVVRFAKYIKIGKFVSGIFYVDINNTSGVAKVNIEFGGLPFVADGWNFAHKTFGVNSALAQCYVENSSNNIYTSSDNVSTGVTSNMYYFTYMATQ